MRSRPDLEAAIEAVLADGTTDHWVTVLEAAGVPCGPVYDYGQMFSDPQVVHRGMVQHATDAELGDVPHIRTPIRIGDDIRVRTVAPKLGQHNAEVFGSAGVDAAELRALKEKGVVCDGTGRGAPVQTALSTPTTARARSAKRRDRKSTRLNSRH